MRVLGQSLVLASVMILGVGCGNLDPAAKPTDPSHDSPWAAGSPPPSPPPSPSPTVTPSGTPAATKTSADTPRGRKDFADGMAAYCTGFYTEQRKVEDRYPMADLASRVAFVRQAAKAAHRTESMLGGLKPPSDLAAAYAEFVANAHEVSLARAAMVDAVTNTGEEGAAGEALDDAITARWPLATELHAPGCDGQLSAGQRAAVIEAVRTFETTTDSSAACRDLATPGYLLTRWPDKANPLAACITSRDTEGRSAPGPARENREIEVQTVTGSDGVAATAHYTGGCRCPNGAVARLHLVDGSWLVSELSH